MEEKLRMMEETIEQLKEDQHIYQVASEKLPSQGGAAAPLTRQRQVDSFGGWAQEAPPATGSIKFINYLFEVCVKFVCIICLYNVMLNLC
jgi:hypothetical protein